MELVIKFAADALLLIIIGVGSLVILFQIAKHNFWNSAGVVVMAGLTSLLAGKLFSLLYQPEIARPFVEMGVSPGAAYIDNPGFPSDHALLGTVIVIAVYAVTRRKNVTLFLLTALLIMCTARVAAYVHTPLDILGGMVAGISGAFWYRKLTK